MPSVRQTMQSSDKQLNSASFDRKPPATISPLANGMTILKLPLPFKHYTTAYLAVADPSPPLLLRQHALVSSPGTVQKYENMNNGLCFGNEF